MFKRFRNFINRLIRGTEQLPPEPAPEPPPIAEPRYTPEATVFPDYYPPPEDRVYGQYETFPLTDDFGVYRGTQTWGQWYFDTTLSLEEFRAKYGYDFHNLDLIDLLEAELGIDWDWEQWRNDYAARNG